MAGVATERFSEQKCTRNIDGNWTATRAWDVINFTSEDDAINATGVLVGAAHPATSSMRCTSIGITENKLTKAIVVANYAVSTINANDPNPLVRVPMIGWKRNRMSLPVDTDINGNPILNSATDAYKNNGTRYFTSRTLTFKRWEPYYNQSLANTYDNATNSDTWTIQGVTANPGQAQLIGYGPIEEYQVGAPFVHVAYEIEIRTPSGAGLTAKQIRYPFQRRILDQGLRGVYKDPSNSMTKTLGHFYLSGSGLAPCTRDVLLNGQGVPIDSTILVTQSGFTAQTQTLPSTVLSDSTTGATFLIYMDYSELPFAGLGIT